MLHEQNNKSKERIRLEEQRAKYEQKLREQIKKDEKRQREREKALKLLIGKLFVKHLPDYMLFEEAEMERIITAAMESEDCRNMIGTIRSEAAALSGNGKPDAFKNSGAIADNSGSEKPERYEDISSTEKSEPARENGYADPDEDENEDYEEDDDNE